MLSIIKLLLRQFGVNFWNDNLPPLFAGRFLYLVNHLICLTFHKLLFYFYLLWFIVIIMNINLGHLSYRNGSTLRRILINLPLVAIFDKTDIEYFFPGFFQGLLKTLWVINQLFGSVDTVI